MEMNLEILNSPAVQGYLAAFAMACTQLIQSYFTIDRKFWLPFTCFLIGSVSALLVAMIPKELLPIFAVMSATVTGSGGLGIVNSTAKTIASKSTTIEVLEPPVVVSSGS